MGDPARGNSWNGHGNGLAATRFQPASIWQGDGCGPAAPQTQVGLRFAGVGAAPRNPPSPVAGCSPPAKMAKCTR
jgi:hypothetical protein